jgi:hypothetical protein
LVVRGQDSTATRPAPTGIAVQLITMGPGPALWEKYGHNAVVVVDHDRGTNLAYNYGIFDFNQDDFVIRFLKGEMRYWMESADTVLMVGPYFQQGRDVWGQSLALSDAQARALQAFLEHNAQPDYKYYDYNYYADNCSTRSRDAIDHATGGEVRRQLSAVRTGRTYRWHTRIAMESDPVMGFGIDYSLAAYADRELSAWDESFLPAQLMRHLRGVTIEGAGGIRVALVERERHLQQAIPELKISDRPPRRWPAMLGIGAGVGGAMLLAGMSLRTRLGRVLAALIWSAWGLAAGIGGTYLLTLWLLTRHVAAYANENLLQTSPLAWLMVVVGPLAAFGRARKIMRLLALACCAMSMLGLVGKALPMLRQDNWDMLALFVPINLGLAAGLLLDRRQVSPPGQT